MGGMMNIVAHLLEYRQPDAFTYHAVLTHNRLNTDVRFAQPLHCDSQTTVEMSPTVAAIPIAIRDAAARARRCPLPRRCTTPFPCVRIYVISA